MAMCLIMLLMSCQSTSYIDRPFVPDIYFPDFPPLDSPMRNSDGTVTVSGDWIRRLAEYKIRIEETERTYKTIQKIYAEK